MQRRTFLRLSGVGAVALGMGGLALGCGGLTDGEGLPVPQLGGPKPTDFKLLDRVPGFRDVGAWTGAGPAPVLIELTLNINDFMRPALEAASVRWWLEQTAARGLAPMDLSFTGHVLQAFVDHTPDLIELVKQQRPAIRQHYRMLKDRKLQDTRHELYWTEPATLEVDESRPGPCLLIQKTFGVTPTVEGGVPGGLLRTAWRTGSKSAELIALGFDKLDRNDQVGHPDRIVAYCLPDIDQQDGREQVEAFLRLRRLERAMLAGQALDASRLEDTYTDLVRWTQVCKELGFDPGAIEGIEGFIDHEELPDFAVGAIAINPRQDAVARFQGMLSSDQAGLIARMEQVGRGLAQRTASLPTIVDELKFKLARLNPTRVYVSRLAWHASNNHSMEGWGEFMYGDKSKGMPFPLTPATERPQDQIDAILDVAERLLDLIADDERARSASMHCDTQWAAENSPEQGWQEVMGVSFARLPAGVTPEQIDAAGAKLGIYPEEGGTSRGKGGGGKAGREEGGADKAGGGKTGGRESGGSTGGRPSGGRPSGDGKGGKSGGGSRPPRGG